MRRTTTVLLILVSGVLNGVSRDASAGIITINATNRGWIAQNLIDNGTAANNNYVTGNCGLENCRIGEYRSWFQFAIPDLMEPIVTARLILPTANVIDEQGASMTLSVTSLPSVFEFSDLGMGTIYGSRSYSSADNHTTQSISLNATALADILASQLGTFGTSGRISAGANFGPSLPNQLVFGKSGGTAETQLEIITVPEPMTLVLMGLGILGVVYRRRKRT